MASQERMHVRLFVFEHLTGGGRYLDESGELVTPSLMSEGRAIIEALSEDLAAIPGVEVCLARDTSLPAHWLRRVPSRPVSSRDELHQVFDRQAAESDWSLVVAPEWDGLLVGYCQRVLQVGGTLLGPPPEWVALASDKQVTADVLRVAGAPSPLGRVLEVGERMPEDFGYPAVRKLRDGAGSRALQLVTKSAAARAAWRPPTRPERLERFCPGLPASVALLCGPDQVVALPGCRQHLADDGTFAYLGGSVLDDQALDRRAARWGLAAVAALGPARGYVGVDLILGDDENGASDYIIEVNPRLTTSYLGLRQACLGNLAAAMLDIACGQRPSLEFDTQGIEFSVKPDDA